MVSTICRGLIIWIREIYEFIEFSLGGGRGGICCKRFGLNWVYSLQNVASRSQADNSKRKASTLQLQSLGGGQIQCRGLDKDPPLDGMWVLLSVWRIKIWNRKHCFSLKTTPVFFQNQIFKCRLPSNMFETKDSNHLYNSFGANTNPTRRNVKETIDNFSRDYWPDGDKAALSHWERARPQHPKHSKQHHTPCWCCNANQLFGHEGSEKTTTKHTKSQTILFSFQFGDNNQREQLRLLDRIENMCCVSLRNRIFWLFPFGLQWIRCPSCSMR